ncbi:MAG TPA: PEP-CTERM sorting domain-containing protein [Telluria sp.]|jgi:hypothetical protein
MIKKLMGALALMGYAMSSQAAVQGYDWSFTGFTPAWGYESGGSFEGAFNPDTRLSGSFFAEDLNRDGSFSRSEVTSFTIDGQSMLNCEDPLRCSLSSFSYTPGSALMFDASRSRQYGEWGSNWSRTSTSYRTGVDFFTVSESIFSSGASWSGHNFTPETRFAISEISAVPEPQTWLMLGAGIALIGAVQRRRPRKA